MKLSIIIVSWNTCELLAQCLRSLVANLGPALTAQTEIFVVDNNSHDGSVAMVQQEFAHVKLVQNSQNVGFAHANNQAIRQSKGQYILLLNPDTEVHHCALEKLIEFIERHPEIGAVGSRLLNSDGSLQVSCYRAPTLSRELWRLLHLDRLYPYGSYKMHHWSMEKPLEVDVVQGACFLVREKVLQQVGLLDESYFMYTEEVDLSYRIRKAGWHIFWVPTATVTHLGGQSTQQVAIEMFLQLYRSKILYFRKHFGSLAANAYKIILMFAGILRLLISPLAFLERQPIRRQRWAQVGNYLRLLFVLPNM